MPAHPVMPDRAFAEERTRVFRHNWFCVGRRDRLTTPGDYFVEHVCGENLILTLDDSEVVRCLFNTCTHRGTQLTAQTEGSFSSCRIICPYHHWAFGCDGQLIGAPNMQERDDFCRQDWPLHQATVSVWKGFLLVWPGDEPRPVESIIDANAQPALPLRLKDLAVVRRERQSYDADWKSVLADLSRDQAGIVQLDFIPNLLLHATHEHLLSQRVIPVDSQQTVVVSEWLSLESVT